MKTTLSLVCLACLICAIILGILAGLRFIGNQTNQGFGYLILAGISYLASITSGRMSQV